MVCYPSSQGMAGRVGLMGKLIDMITYEIAQKLKDNGFPQEHRYVIEAGKGFIHFVSDNACFYMPTLEELIEACGNGFWSLSCDGTTRNDLWTARAFSNIHPPYRGRDSFEAVANLWIGINRGVDTLKDKQ